MRLAAIRDPFDHPDWIFEVKYDGFRALACVGPDGARLLSRNRHVYKPFTFDGLAWSRNDAQEKAGRDTWQTVAPQ